MNALKSLIIVCLLFCFFDNHTFSLTLSDTEIMHYQLDVTQELSDYLSELFQSFSDGYLESEGALEKLSVYSNDYSLAISPPLDEGKKLYDLMKTLLSHAENYFIFYKRVNRENPDINHKIFMTKQKIARELVRISYLL